MAGQQFAVYRLMSPSGRCYVGFTGQPVKERWRQHVNRANAGVKHPLCSAIRKYGPENFQVETLFETENRSEALRAEVEHIAEQTNAYNISPGGDDGKAGNDVWREKLRSDPEYRAEYCARLSAAIRASDKYAAAIRANPDRSKTWRDENPREAYRLARRGLRAALKALGREPREAGRIKPKPKGKAARFRKSINSREAAKRHWADMPSDRKEEVHGLIAEGVKRFNRSLLPAEKAERDTQLAAARKSIDHTLRKARQKEGLEKYWTPERRAAFGAKVKARNAAKKEAENADL